MTKPIEGVSERILSCAKEGFLEKGYADASLRTIAAKAETTTGSIYSRFRDKEGLFGALVEPAAGGRTLEILNESDYEYSLKAIAKKYDCFFACFAYNKSMKKWKGCEQNARNTDHGI